MKVKNEREKGKHTTFLIFNFFSTAFTFLVNILYIFYTYHPFYFIFYLSSKHTITLLTSLFLSLSLSLSLQKQERRRQQRERREEEEREKHRGEEGKIGRNTLVKHDVQS